MKTNNETNNCPSCEQQFNDNIDRMVSEGKRPTHAQHTQRADELNKAYEGKQTPRSQSDTWGNDKEGKMPSGHSQPAGNSHASDQDSNSTEAHNNDHHSNGLGRIGQQVKQGIDKTVDKVKTGVDKAADKVKEVINR